MKLRALQILLRPDTRQKRRQRGARVPRFLNIQFALASSMLIGLLALAGCGEDGSWAKKYEYGAAIPDARVTVTLPHDADKYELYVAFGEAARLSGYTRYEGRPFPKNYLELGDHSEYFRWSSEPGSQRLPNTLAFIWLPHTDYPRSFEAIYAKDTTEPFTPEEWLEFYELYENFLPAAFPHSTFEITSHPALFTRPSQLLQISEETGIAIPDKIMKKYEKWLAEQ